MNSNKKNVELLRKWLTTDIAADSSALVNEKELIREAERKALNLFHEASKRVPAYKNFLKKNRIDPKRIKTIKDFNTVPLTTKENYIDIYDFKKRCWDGDIKNMHMISTSSGTTDVPHFWPRDLQNEIDGAYIHELIFQEVLKIHNKKTLFVNGFAMGNWIAGTFTSSCVNLVSWKGYPITLMSPGYVTDALLQTIKNISSEFEEVIISGHVPFLKEIIEQGVSYGIDWKKMKVKLLGTGQGITENWRSYLLKKIGSEEANSIINLYGSADAALMGFETAFSIEIRKKLTADMTKNKKIFNNDRLPSLYNYDPRFTYFEGINRELSITKNSGCPLIRYNIHDEGGVLPFSEVTKFFGKDLRGDNKWQLPFVYLFGRDKFLVKIFGANVYSEHVQHALSHEMLQPMLTGRYVLEMDYDKDNNPEMVCRIELNPQIEESPELIKEVQRIFVSEVRKLNSEYNYVLENVGDKVKPRIILHSHGHEKYFPKGKVKKTS
jgi:phenylacetate-CoA ligase